VYTEASRKHRHTLLMLHVVLVHNVSGRGKRHGTSEGPGGVAKPVGGLASVSNAPVVCGCGAVC